AFGKAGGGGVGNGDAGVGQNQEAARVHLDKQGGGVIGTARGTDLESAGEGGGFTGGKFKGAVIEQDGVGGVTQVGGVVDRQGAIEQSYDTVGVVAIGGMEAVGGVGEMESS